MHVPVEGSEFSREERVVLTFADGTMLSGRVDNGETVTYEDDERQLRGTVESVDETQIEIGDLVVVRTKDSSAYERARMHSFRLYADEEELDRLILERDQILQVERVVNDKRRTMTRMIFWGVGAGVTLLSVRDRNF